MVSVACSSIDGRSSEAEHSFVIAVPLQSVLTWPFPPNPVAFGVTVIGIDQSLKLSSDGMPSTMIVRGVTPQGNAGDASNMSRESILICAVR